MLIACWIVLSQQARKGIQSDWAQDAEKFIKLQLVCFTFTLHSKKMTKPSGHHTVAITVACLEQEVPKISTDLEESKHKENQAHQLARTEKANLSTSTGLLSTPKPMEQHQMYVVLEFQDIFQLLLLLPPLTQIFTVGFFSTRNAKRTPLFKFK